MSGQGSGENVPKARRSPSMLAAEYRRKGSRLLARLTEPDMHAERREDQIVLVRKAGAVSIASGLPTGILAELLQTGAVRCETRAGRAMFRITEAGRARLRREAAGEDPFGAQHRVIEERHIEHAGQNELVRVNIREDPLQLLRQGRFAARFVGSAELDAGERLRRDIATAQMLPQVTANWSRLVVDGVSPGQGLTISEAILAARQRVARALAAVDPDFRGMLIDVCGFSKGVEMLEREHDLPVRSGKVVLAFALRQLARHYGLSSEAIGPERGGTRHWGAAGYRPELKAG